MKKFISLALALVMICAMATTAFATENYNNDAKFTITTSTADGATGSGTASTWNIDVSAGLQAETVTESDVDANYYVVVEWDITSDLVYSIGKSAYSWQVNDTNSDGVVENAGYVVDYSKGTWTGSAVIDVTVTNWSNRSVTAAVAFDPAEKNDAGVAADIKVKDGATAISNERFTIDAASKDVVVKDGVTTEKAGQNTSKVTLDGTTIEGGIDKDDAVIGVVTVTLTGINTDYTTAGGQTTTTTPEEST